MADSTESKKNREAAVLIDFIDTLNNLKPPFRVVKFLSAGGMGAVYQVELTGSKQLAALKIIFPTCMGNANYVKRFIREAKTLAALIHPCLLRYYDAGQIGDYYFILTEFCDGGSLLDLLGQVNNRLSLDLVVYIIRGCLSGLQHAHNNNVIHRDLKPGNIFISRNLSEVKIGDFGLAKKMDLTGPENQNLTVMGHIIGTYGFMAPEQLDGNIDKLSPAADIFSLGVMFFYLLTGILPFGVGAHYRLNIQREDPPIDLLKQYPAEIQYIVGRMIARDLGRRFRNCTEVIHELKRVPFRNPSTNFKREDLSLEVERMVAIPRGPFLYSAINKQVELPPFFIDKYPVTNYQYKNFLWATGHPSPPHYHSRDAGVFLGLVSAPIPEFPPDFDFHPVVGISLNDARAYASWAGKKLPTPRQWEKAARGAEGNIYPWGPQFFASHLNFGKVVDVESRKIFTTPVFHFPQGISPFGCLDMAGNVWEMCEDPRKGEAFIKGGGWNELKLEHFAGYYRQPLDANQSSPYVGFRCVRE